MAHTIVINKDGIFIDGEPKILLCSSLFYFRIPEVCWRDRMEKLKLCGYNCIDVYFPWNYHELSPGVWDFTGQRNADEFLSLASEMGLYVIARPGPYICSEWDGGGLPAFLDNDGLRTNSEVYLKQLDRWMARILPIIARRQVTAGGSVVMLQLENELDYFASRNPKEYIDYLVHLAKNHGIEVPLIACAGQWNAEAAAGDAQDVIVTYNVYMNENEPLFEDRCIKIQKKLYENGLPFLITETHRPHSLLKRELCCGARLISPYNQTAGVNYDLYNGISNWSDIKDHFPLSYMASDYDFPATMISAEGRLRDEALQARLFSNLIRTFPALAAGQPVTLEDIKISADFPTPQTIDEYGRKINTAFGYKFDDGILINLTNLSDKPGRASVFIGGDTLSADLKPMQTKLLPVSVSLKNFGVNATILWSEAEIAWIKADTDSCEVLLYSDGVSSCCLEAGDDANFDTAGNHVARRGNKIIIIRGQDCVNNLLIEGKLLKIMLYGSEKASRMESLWLKEFEKPVEPITQNLPVLGTGDVALLSPTEAHPVQNLEKYGVYRGGGVYELDIEKNARLLLHNVADIVFIYHDGEFVDACHKSGITYSLGVSPGKWTFVIESWGHSNFNDIRLPSLRMGSTKGIGAITSLCCEEDITDLYYVKFDQFPFDDANYPFEHEYCKTEGQIPTITSVNETIRSEVPLCISYSRRVYAPDNCNRFILYFNGNKAYTAVYINGRFHKTVDPADPYVDVSNVVAAGNSFELTLRVMKANSYQPVGRVYFLSGVAVDKCRFAPIDLSYYISLANVEVAESGNYPLEVKRGRFRVAKLKIPQKNRDARIIFDGSDMELFCMLNGHVVGRILLPTDGFPQVKGGDPCSITFPAEWGKNEPLTVLMCGIGKKPQLRNVSISF